MSTIKLLFRLLKEESKILPDFSIKLRSGFCFEDKNYIESFIIKQLKSIKNI